MTATLATSITVRVPIAVRRRGGRKVIVTPDSAAAPGGTAVPTCGDPALVKALARGHLWRRMLEGGRHRSLRELAAAEGVDRGYVARLLQLTLLAPDAVEAILNGWRPTARGLQPSTAPLPARWDEQGILLRAGRRERDPAAVRPAGRWSA
jgi:hypothetical protein